MATHFIRVTALSLLCVNAFVEQLHLSFTGLDSSIGVDFVTNSSSARVLFEPVAADGQRSEITTSATFFVEIGWLHEAVMENLTAKAFYRYCVAVEGDKAEDEYSSWFNFQAPPYERPGGDVAAVFADFGLVNDVSMGAMSQDAASQEVDYFLHAGDIAYDLMDNASEVGNEFMRRISDAFASTHPYMVTPGNHERKDNFTNYNLRFQGIANHVAPASKNSGDRGKGGNFYYSFDIGLVHYIMIDTEIYKYKLYTQQSLFPFTAEDQLQWLEQDLKAASAPEQRAVVPWIIMLGHKGWYMDNLGTVSLDDEEAPDGNFTGFDRLACEYGVDLYLTGHVHLYQRFLPMLGPATSRILEPPRKVDHDSVSVDGHSYINPRFMPTIVVGSPGDQEITPRVGCFGLDGVSRIGWDDAQAVCTAEYGYGHLRIVNASHLKWEFRMTGRSPGMYDHTHVISPRPLKKPIVRDYLWLIQNNHAPRDYCNS